MNKWEELGNCGFWLGEIAAGDALGRLGWRKPTLFVGPHSVGKGHVVASSLALNLMVDEDLDYTSWYIEYDGRRVGSIGA